MITPVENILLRRPFDVSLVSFRPGGGAMFAHADPRAYMNRLNDVFPSEWSTTSLVIPFPDRVAVVTDLTIRGITRSDVGEEILNPTARGGGARVNENAITTAKAQSFKRACATFGLGEYFYHFENLRGDAGVLRERLAREYDYRFWAGLEEIGASLRDVAEALATGASMPDVFKQFKDASTPQS